MNLKCTKEGSTSEPRAASSAEHPGLPWWGTGAAVRGVSSRVASGTERRKNRNFLKELFVKSVKPAMWRVVS